MKRKILFRGKRKEDGEWAEGYFVYAKSDFDDETLREADISPHDTDRVYKGEYNVVYPCIPETVGQYTGVDDRNGKKIFENDIVLVYARGYHTVCTVAWAETVAHFQLWQVNTVPGTPTALNLGNYDCEVIGNTIDNPELLEV